MKYKVPIKIVFNGTAMVDAIDKVDAVLIANELSSKGSKLVYNKENNCAICELTFEKVSHIEINRDKSVEIVKEINNDHYTTNTKD